MRELTSGNVVKLEEGQKIDGEFVSIEESAQYKDSYALKLRVEDELKVVFVSNIVADLLKGNDVQPGTMISVLFKGMKSNRAGTAKYKDYAVLVE